MADGLRRPTAHRLYVLMFVASAAAIASLGLCVLDLLLSVHIATAMWHLVAMGILLGAFLALFGAAHLAERRELVDGYTTLRRLHRAVEQRDPRSGEIVRAAGAPFDPKS